MPDNKEAVGVIAGGILTLIIGVVVLIKWMTYEPPPPKAPLSERAGKATGNFFHHAVDTFKGGGYKEESEEDIKDE